METLTNNSLKEYYVKLLKMYENAVNMITAMNQSLSTSSSEVTVTYVSGDDTETTLRIPSMLYLENKIEQLQNNFETLFRMPSSGEAWFSNNADMYKLELITSGTTPVQPKIDGGGYASITDNNFLKDLVSPKTFLRLDIGNLPDNIEKMFMKKIIFNNVDAFTTIKGMGISTYEEYSAAMYNLVKGIDYDEYDNTLDLPIKSGVYDSAFAITDIPVQDSGNPWYDATSVFSDGHEHLSYKLYLDTLTYHNAEDSSIEFTLRAGDFLSLNGKNVIYRVKEVNTDTMSVIVEEWIGHIALQPISENSSMVLSLYKDNFSEYHYVQVPLEENQYIAVFLGCIYNNTRSLLSDAYLIDLSTVYMYDENGNKITDKNGNHMTYMEYYQTYCTNIGDLILGITEAAYPQLSNYPNGLLNDLQDSEVIKSLVNETVTVGSNVEVLPINKHLVENTSTEEIINLHAQKSEINSKLNTLQKNIDNVHTTLISTDFSQETVITQESLQAELKGYYTERTELTKQLNAIIDNISSVSADVTVSRNGTKYRVRGVANTDTLETYLKEIGDSKLTIIGMDVEYKYKSITKDTTSVTSIDSNIFTDWNKLQNIDKQRKLVFNSTASSYSIEYEDYSSTQNVIKWNQIDIPIVQGEDVVFRFRYKYNIGQPFINIYTPWSDEQTAIFPTEFKDNTEIDTILSTNENDVVTAKFTKTLIDNGYEEHVNNSLTVNSVTFYHMPENIYSGFNTAENNYISLKDKLHDMDASINETKNLVNSEINKKYAVYLQYDGNSYELFNNSINKINIYNSDHITDSFVRKPMNIVIKNTGDVAVRFYSIFPGNVDIPLLLDNEEFYEQYISHYERVPLFIDGQIEAQTLGQWIYFRQDNPYTGKNIYYVNEGQNLQDYRAAISDADGMIFTSINTYIKKDFNQTLLGFRRRSSSDITVIGQSLVGLDFSTGVCEQLSAVSTTDTDEIKSAEEAYMSKDISFFKYLKDTTNNYIPRFEDICATDPDNNIIYLDYESSMSEFIANNTVNGLTFSAGAFVGAFLYPDIAGRKTILTDGNYNSYVELGVGKSISVPVMFEYYIDGETITKITKGLYFDLRDSLIQNPVHYMLEVTANYDYTSTGSLINNTSLSDEAATY